MTLWRPTSYCLMAAAAFGAGVGRADSVTNHPYRGITHITRTETIPRTLNMQIVVIDLSAPGLRFKLTQPGGARETIKQTTLNFLNQENAQVAINAHFYVPTISNDTNANVIGFAASEGIVYSPFEPQPLGTDYVDQSYAILSYAPALNIDSCNRASIIHRDPANPDNAHVLEPVTLWNAVSGSARIISNGVKTIPTYSGQPDGLNPINNYSDTNSWYSCLRARSVIGLTRQNENLILFTVDETGGSLGMTPGEAAGLLINDYQIYNALNLDGDGSTTPAMEDPVTHVGQIVNAASFPFGGRATGSNLAVFAQLDPEPPVMLTLASDAAGNLVISWPAPGTGWRLQENPGLNPADWADARAVPECVRGRMEVSLMPNGAGGFYRLTK